MAVLGNTYAPHVVKTVIEDNWNSVAGAPVATPVFYSMVDPKGFRVPDNLYNFIMFHQVGRARDMGFSTMNNSAYNSRNHVKVVIRAFDRTNLILFYSHLVKVMNVGRERPSSLHTTMHRVSYVDESNRANRVYKIVLTVLLRSQHLTF